MGGFYINYCFDNIEYGDDFYGGIFSSPDDDIYCEFLYDRKSGKFVEIWNNNKPVEDILPIPIHWLDWRLEENGRLRKKEYKISY